MTQKPQEEIQNFWGALYGSLYTEVDKHITPEYLKTNLVNLENMFVYRSHMAVTEIALKELMGKKLLEIGPGAGAHSALFAKYGAKVTSADISFKRAFSTQKKFSVLENIDSECQAIQANAENLPFADNSFDIIYSNGVLHHTENTEKAVAEVYRLLKPRGRAVIMLYCKSSWHYWINMLFCVGILRGRLFQGKNWLGPATEWGGAEKQVEKNPYTKCYTKNEIKRLFRNFNLFGLRKAEFYFYLIPIIGRLYRSWQKKHYGSHPGGNLVYGEPWPIQSPLELNLGRFIGFAWFITAIKDS